MRVTRLSEYTFHAVVVLAGPGAPREVDARPGDALNLALVCDVPVRVDRTLFDDPAVARYDAWQGYATAAPEIAAEVRDNQAKPREKMTVANRKQKDPFA